VSLAEGEAVTSRAERAEDRFTAIQSKGCELIGRMPLRSLTNSQP
jgi:hypothetical protein